MPTDRWHRLEHIFAQAMAQPAEAREHFLARSCGPDAAMRGEVQALLDAVEQSGDFLALPALDVFAQQVSREGWSVRPGDRIAHYTVDRRLGAGGMGEVWRARDERLARDVAIKLLLPHPSNAAKRVRALEQEARAAGTLNHANVLTVYDVGEHRGGPYLVTECLEGEPLRARLGTGALPVELALDVGLQVAKGLGAAHAQGIVHRDLKPENVFLTRDGRVKILDFGLAQRQDSQPPARLLADFPEDTARSLIAGTAGYMAPEQVRGEVVDPRADIFALGVVLYEMLAGVRPFKADTTLATLDAVLTRTPVELGRLSPRTPPALSRLVQRCLAKSADQRFANIEEVVAELEAILRERSSPPRPPLLSLLRQPLVLLSGLLVIGALAAAGLRWRSTAQLRWARIDAAPEVQRLLNQGDLPEAFLLARRALQVVPEDPLLKRLWLDVSIPAVITSDPEGADVELAPYDTRVAGWAPLGRTPLKDVRIPRGLFRLRISKPGLEPLIGTGSPGTPMRYRLDPTDSVPPGMVRVAGGRAAVRFGRAAELEDFFIDRFEVTNRQFKEFVDRGGYARPDHWREPFVDGGITLSWQEAMLKFRDLSGRPGPATWKAGTYPEGQAEFPVSGVSWYEAAAYAAYAHKSLPTLYHWYQAASLGRFADILKVSNFAGTGPAQVGSHRGLGPFGTYDMAGNVKEWCWTETERGRFLLGGAWNERRHMFDSYDARGPFERAPNHGFRLAKYGASLAPAVSAPVRTERLGRDPRREQPVEDDIFSVYRRQFAYDRGPLNADLEAPEDLGAWRKQSIAFDAAYGGERLQAFLFLPKQASAPYQTVVFFPPGEAYSLRTSREMSIAWAEPLLRSGRALLYPVYKGTYERRTTTGKMGPNDLRDRRVAWSRDLGRSIDYLESRSDIDLARLTFYAVGAGSGAVILAALEPRLKFAVLQGAGISIYGDVAPEVDALNYAPRVRVPTLMLNARYDFDNPVDLAQRPLFELLGTSGEHKRHIIVESGHSIPIEDGAREILPWLDRYLGPAQKLRSLAMNR